MQSFKYVSQLKPSKTQTHLYFSIFKEVCVLQGDWLGILCTPWLSASLLYYVPSESLAISPPHASLDVERKLLPVHSHMGFTATINRQQHWPKLRVRYHCPENARGSPKLGLRVTAKIGLTFNLTSQFSSCHCFLPNSSWRSPVTVHWQIKQLCSEKDRQGVQGWLLQGPCWFFSLFLMHELALNKKRGRNETKWR